MIGRNDLGRFLHRYDPARIEAWHYLPALLGRLCLAFEGYDENWLITPTLRRFWRVLHECWPYAVLFCDLDQRDLAHMVLGSLKSFRVLAVPGQSNRAIGFERDELEAFLDHQFEASLERCYAHRGIRRTLWLRRREVCAYLRHPLEAVVSPKR